MEKTITWTDKAEASLHDVFEYISFDNLRAADNVVDGIHEKVQLLLDYPEIGWKYGLVSDKEVRIILYGHYRIAYHVPSPNQIVILGVFHSSMKIEKYLK